MVTDLESGPTSYEDELNPLVEPSVDIVDTQSLIYFGDTQHKIILLDISADKQWIAYVTNKLVDEDSSEEVEKEHLFITRRRFTAIDQTTEKEELAFSGNPVGPEAKLSHTSIEITEFVEDGRGTHCRFLSISPDGNYVALSFLESKATKESNRGPSPNPDCLVFDMNKNSSQVPRKIEHEGRAVFLNKKNSLAIINTKAIRTFEKFPKSIDVTAVFDLSAFYTTEYNTREMAYTHDSYIANTSWFNISDSLGCNDINSIITYTRHIRHNIITTPFINSGIVRIWSMAEDGSRLSSFVAKRQHIMAFSTNYRYTAAYVEDTRSVNIYNVKSGLLVYQLKSRVADNSTNFTVSHIRFCYDSRYIAMSGWEGNDVVFEVWYVEAEKSIYRVIQKVDVNQNTDLMKLVQPFVARGIKGGRKCLKGYYTAYLEKKLTIMCTELDIDKECSTAILNWMPTEDCGQSESFEIENNLMDYEGLRCSYIEFGEKKYLLRFGKHTIQLWDTNSKDKDSPITDNDNLLYIRAYKGPDYGHDYSFRETWEIQDFKSIKFIGGTPSGRLIVNIKESNNDISETKSTTYHTEEIFLPLDEKPASSSSSLLDSDSGFTDNNKTPFDYHKLESACQALHYLYHSDYYNNSTNKNLQMLRKKTKSIIHSAIDNINTDSNFFSTIAGSKTLAMLASFDEGIEIIKSIIMRAVPISIFSYARSRSEINEFYPARANENIDEGVHMQNTSEIARITSGPFVTNVETNMPSLNPKEISYRSSPYIRRPLNSYSSDLIARNENVLTVLIEKNQDLYKLLFNRILSDSKKLGPGCLSLLTDALLYLQEGGYNNLLLLSSQKLSYLEIEFSKLGILEYEKNEIIIAKAKSHKNSSSETENLEAHATMEQIKMYKGFSIHMYHLQEKFLQWPIWNYTKRKYLDFYSKINKDSLTTDTYLNSEKEVVRSTSICVVPITHFNSYSNLLEDRPRHTNSIDDDCMIIGKKRESAFARVSLDQRISSMFQLGDIVLEVLLKYKWEHFARKKFILICIIHALYYTSYSTGVLFAPELYGINLEEDFFMEHPLQIASLVTMFICLFIFFIQETRQFFKKKDKLDYFCSGYNWIDMAAFAIPVYTFIQLCYNLPQFVEVCSISTLILWTHAILRLRVISYFGITLETVIQLSRRMGPVLFIMLLVTLAFTQSYIVLLRLQPDSYFQDTFEGTFLSRDGSAIPEGTVEFATSSSDNSFIDWFQAFYNVWLFIYGVWDPIVEGDIGDSKMVMVMSIVFSLIAVLIFFNMVIAIMSSAVEDVTTLGKKVWVSHFTDVVSEIETLWCFDDEKYSRKNNPAGLYYMANKEAIQEQKDELQRETKRLLDEIGINLVQI